MNKHSTEPEYPDNNYGNLSQQNMYEENPINWKKYFFLFLSNWYWFMITVGISLGIVFFKNRYKIPEYESTATLIIEENDGNQDLMNEIRSIRYMRRRTEMANELAKLGSFSLAKRTVENIDQDVFWTAHGRLRQRPLYENPIIDLQILDDSENWYKDQVWFIDIVDNDKYRFYKDEGIDTILYYNIKQNINGWKFLINKTPEENGHTTYSFVVNNTITLAKHYKAKLQIETDEKEGTLIVLSSTGPVGEREADYLNAICKSYIASGLERKQQIADNTFQFIDEQIEVILDSLHQSEKQLLTFRLTNNVINLSREGDLAYERLKDLTDRKTQLKLKENYYNYLQKYVGERNDPQTIISPTIADSNDELLIGAVQKLQKLYEDRENLNFSVAENNPGVESINALIQSTRLRILEIINGLMDNNALTQKQINIEERAVIDQLKTLPINEQHLLNIKRKYDLYNQFYTFLLQRRAEAGIQKASTISNARVLDPARYDQIIPLGSNSKISLIIGLIVGIILPATFFILREVLDNRIHEREDIINNTDIPIIGIIGHSTSKGILLSVKENSNSAFTESLRHIRTNVQFILRNPDQKVIMITSSMSGEGKTFSATNLAAIFAINNKKVLLIGCDLRKPVLHKIFDVENSTGLSSILIEQSTVKNSTYQTKIENLTLLPAGPIPPNPAELLETNEWQKLISKLKKEYDYIILDTPPVALVSDSLSLAQYADMTLYVIRQNYSQKDVIHFVNQMKIEKKLPNIALLINDVEPSKSLGYNYYYGYGSGYNYGYYNHSNYYSENKEI